MSTPTAPAKKESLLLNITCNVLLPSVILTQLAKPERLGPLWALLVALSFPIAYGIYDLAVRRKWNFFSVLGFVSVLLTGGLGLLEVAAIWIAVKEAAVPLILAGAIVASLWTRTPLVRTMIYNDQVVDTERVAAALTARDCTAAFETLLRRASWLLAGAFVVSAITNFVLAQLVLKSPPDSPAFKEEMGRMFALSWPVNVLPCLIMTMLVVWYLFSGIKRLTGLSLDDVFRAPPAKKA